MNMVEERESNLFFLRIFPKCPFYKSATAVSIILILIALGTWGIYYLNFWIAVVYLIYSLLFYFLVMPLTMCKYCYFKVTETTIDEEKGESTERLLIDSCFLNYQFLLNSNGFSKRFLSSF